MTIRSPPAGRNAIVALFEGYMDAIDDAEITVRHIAEPSEGIAITECVDRIKNRGEWHAAVAADARC